MRGLKPGRPCRVSAMRASLVFMNRDAVVLVLISAVLFGASTPAAKALLGAIDPTILAGLLYCGAGIGVAFLRHFGHRFLSAPGATEVALSGSDWPWLLAAILVGGIIGPILLMLGLTHTDAAAASLLLTLEGVATALMAWFIFDENFNRRVALGMACLVAGAVVLSWSQQPNLASVAGPMAIVGACIAWGLDNNLTRRVSLADPLQIVELKGLIAGPVNLLLGFSAGGHLPGWSALAAAGLIGFLGYGVSLALFVRALRHLGTARTAAYFSTAPFFGAVVAIVFLHEPLTLQLIAAGLMMAVGVWLHLTERHEHEHVHESMEHVHPHVHDAHHQHEHGPDDPPGEPHTHAHRHERLKHTHPHVPDMHHTHEHRTDRVKRGSAG
jgi:drug/metabolite transporter (DMT)-like permease